MPDDLRQGMHEFGGIHYPSAELGFVDLAGSQMAVGGHDLRERYVRIVDFVDNGSTVRLKDVPPVADKGRIVDREVAVIHEKRPER